MVKRTRKRLPQTIPPMLARLGEAFDSPDFLFEIKWDGTRALCFREGQSYRLQNRRHDALKDRYPELSAALSNLPAGCVIDGEIVVLRGGRPDFGRLLQREQARTSMRIGSLARSWPVTYLAFDLLYDRYLPILDRPLTDRRQRLRTLMAEVGDAHVTMSEGVVGDGRLYFEQAVAQELEGVVAKRLTSPYLPGQRTDHWIKIKRRQRTLCAIVGYVPDPIRGLKSLVIAAEFDGELRCVGKVGSGIGEAMSRRLLSEMRKWHRGQPLVACTINEKLIHWLEPGLFCEVSYLERTEEGNLRSPVFERWVEPPEGR